MGRLLAVDPGVKNIAVASFDGEKLVKASLYRSKEQFGSVPDLCNELAFTMETNPYDELAIEVPQVYRSSPNPQNLIDLTFVAGAVWGTMTIDCDFCVLTRYLPREWKGNQPKEATQRRVEEVLSEAEKKRINWPIKSLRHNVYDAIGIGLYHLGRY